MSSITSQCDFPGYTVISAEESRTHQFETGTIMAGEAKFTVHILRAINFGPGAEFPFLVSEVRCGDEVIWEYKSCGHNEHYGRLAWADDELVVAFIGKGPNGKVVDVAILTDILAHTQSSLDRKIQLKHAAAKFLRRDVEYSLIEQKVIDLVLRRQREEESVRLEEEQRVRLAQKLEKRAAIMRRSKVHAFTLSGELRSGIPVVGDEWYSLPARTGVILVESYDNGVVGKLIESFVVDKAPGGGKAKKVKCVAVKATRNEHPESKPVQPVRSVVVEGSGAFHEVLIFRSMDEIRTVRKQGLNGGTRVAVETSTSRIEVFVLMSGNMKNEGAFNIIE